MTDLVRHEPPNVAIAAPPRPLASERVIINAPMSFAGAAQRSWRLTERTPRFVWALLALLVVLPIWWLTVVGWYLTFGLLLVPYRLLRRGARKRKAEALRHREVLAAIDRDGFRS